jgi:hypothetical protein
MTNPKWLNDKLSKVDYAGRAKPQCGPDEFYCAKCQEIFPKGWTDEEALNEKTELFPDAPLEECDYLCDDCFIEIEKWMKGHDISWNDE